MITKSEYKTLMRFADFSREDVYLSSLSPEETSRVRNLYRLGLIALYPDDSDYAYIAGTTAAGRHEMELYNEQRSRDRWTLALSVVAAVLSVIAIIAQLLQQQLSTIVWSWLQHK